MGLFGCKKQKYSVISDLGPDWVRGIDKKYAEGEKVKLCFFIWATDTDYTFYLDGKEINASDFNYDDGYVITFTMPDHDVTFSYSSVNSMYWNPDTDDIPEPETPDGPDTAPSNEVMLVDYYTATVATVGGDGYDEYVLSSIGDSKEAARLDYYARWEGDEEETHVSYTVPYEAVEKAYEAIDRERLRNWNDEDMIGGITGGVVVVKFLDGEEYVRLSTDDMPEDGKERLHSVGSVLVSYAREEYRDGEK